MKSKFFLAGGALAATLLLGACNNMDEKKDDMKQETKADEKEKDMDMEQKDNMMMITTIARMFTHLEPFDDNSNVTMTTRGQSPFHI